jgi:hypothetical protein
LEKPTRQVRRTQLPNQLSVKKEAGNFILHVLFSQFPSQLYIRVACNGVEQRHVWRALLADGISADQHNLLARLNARFQQGGIDIGKHVIESIGELDQVWLHAP